MRSLSVIWRLVRRGTALNRAQAMLIIGLVCLPMIGLSGTALVIQSRNATDAETLTALLGQTQSRVSLVSPPDPSLRQTPPGSGAWTVDYDAKGDPAHEVAGAKNPPVASLLPTGTRVLRLADSTVELRTRTGVADLPATLGSVWDPSFRGRFSVVAGRAPQNSHEIMVSAPTLQRLGAKLGDEVQLRQPIAGAYTVSGIVDDRRVARTVQEVFLPDGAFNGTDAAPDAANYNYYLPSLDLNEAQATVLNHGGYVVVSRGLVAKHGLHDWQTIQSSSGELWLLLGIALLFGAFLTVLLASSAFVIGARQRQRVLAVIASTGAPRRVLFGLVSATGVTLGALGGVIGAAAGVGAGTVYLRLTADGSAAHYPGYHFHLWLYLAMVLVAALIGFLAALLPAVTASRLDVVAALRGSSRPVRLKRRRPIAGAVITICGAAIATGAGVLSAGIDRGWFNTPSGNGWVESHSGRLSTLLVYALTGGVIVMQIGLILLSGLVLTGVQAALRHTSIAARLASRDLGRNRSRAVPAIASIMTTSFLAVMLMGQITTNDATSAASYYWQTADDQAYGWVTATPDPGTSPGEVLSRLTTAMSRNLDIGRPTVISSVATPDDVDDPAHDRALYPLPIVPAANACPQHVGDDAYPSVQWNARDWRCSDVWTTYTRTADAAPTMVVGNVQTLAAIIGGRPFAAATAALDTGGAVALHRAFVGTDGQLRLGWYTAEAAQSLWQPKVMAAPERTAEVSVAYQETAHPLGFGVVLSPAAAARLGIAATPTNALAPLRHAPTTAQLDSLASAVDVLSHGSSGMGAGTEVGPGATSPVYIWGALSVSALIAIAAAVVALTLARHDAARDTAAYDAIGASPSLRRRLAFWQGAIVVGTGAVLGTLTATLTVYAAWGTKRYEVFAMPWPEVAAGTIGLTLIIAAGAWAAAGSARPDERSVRAIA